MPNHSIQAKINAFLIVYFYELEVLLNADQKAISEIKFQSEESNTDEFIKRFLQQFLLKHNSIKSTKIKNLALDASAKTKSIKVSLFNKFEIIDVILPEFLTKELKQKLAGKTKSVYTNPDLLLKIEGYNSTHYESVEIKSTKNNAIPGSSIQQVKPYEWVIFLKRNKAKTTITTGQYIHSINEKLPFPDRSPRPIVTFNTLSNWNKKNRYKKQDTLIIDSNIGQEEQKLKLLKDWQEILTEEWMGIILSKQKNKSEKWFNNTLRKFAVKLLKHSSNSTKKELDLLIEDLKKLIN